MFVEIQECALFASSTRHRSDGRRPHGKRGAMVEREHRSQRVRTIADAEDLVFRVDRIDDVRWIDFDQSWLRCRPLSIDAWRCLRSPYPIGQRKRNIQILSQYHVGKLRQRTMDMCVSRIPMAICHVNPASQAKTRLVRIAYVKRFFDWQIFLSSLNSKRVLPGAQLNHKRVGRQCCVNLLALWCCRAKSLVVSVAAANRLDQMPRALFGSDVYSCRYRLPGFSIDHRALNDCVVGGFVAWCETCTGNQQRAYDATR